MTQGRAKNQHEERPETNLCVRGQMNEESGAQTDPLPSWNDSPAKQAIVEFVRATTDKASPKFVPPEARIAAFDQDGATWVEQPRGAAGSPS